MKCCQGTSGERKTEELRKTRLSEKHFSYLASGRPRRGNHSCALYLSQYHHQVLQSAGDARHVGWECLGQKADHPRSVFIGPRWVWNVYNWDLTYEELCAVFMLNGIIY